MKRSRKVIYLLIVFSVTFCISCKNQEKIERLKNEILTKESEDVVLNDSIAALTNTIRANTALVTSKTEHANSITDSVKAFVYESPIASLYIHENDKQPIEVLQEYFEADSDEARNILFWYHAGLLLYGLSDYNQQTITMVREGLQGFDYRKRQCIAEAQNLNTQISELELAKQQKEQQLQENIQEIKNLQISLDEEENKGIL